MNSIISKTLQILIVDDDELFSESLSLLLKEILTKKSCFEFAYSGNTALELLEKIQFDVVFLDNKLPDRNGLTILNEIRRKKIHTNVIIITGYSDEEIAVKAMKMGAVDYISKGNIDIPRLSESLNDIMIENCSSLELDPEVLDQINAVFVNQDDFVPKQALSLISQEDKIIELGLIEGLEILFEHGLVEKTQMFSTPSCPNCSSLPDQVYLTCPICESKVLEKGDVIEHNKCHHIDFKIKFVDENDRFTCPKCDEVLKQIGVDYVKIGSNYRCNNSHIFPHPDHKYVCGNCQNEFTENQAELKDIFKYKLLENGKTSLLLCESNNVEEHWLQVSKQ